MILYWYLLIVALPVVLVRSKKLICTKDEDCDEEYSCSDKICTKCLKCDVLLRKGSDCVTDFNQCRECLEGFEEVLLTDSSHVIKPCKPVRLKEKLNGEKCIIDNSCPPDNYCHDQICVRCFNCSLLNRVSIDKCAKELGDCGSCINGYEEVAVTTDSILKACERQGPTNVLRTRMYNMSAIDCAFFLASVSVLAFATAIYFKLKKGSVLKKSKCLVFPSAPPLHEMDIPQHIIKCVEQKPHVALTVEQSQQAKVFKQPNASYYYEEDQMNGNNYASQCVPNNTLNFSGPTGSDQSESGMVNSGRIFVNNYLEPREPTDSPHQSLRAINEVDASNINDNSSQLFPGLFLQVINSNNSQPVDVPVEEAVSTSSSTSQFEVDPST